ncbi:metallophosphoesterase [uncultured Acetobacteroides sp.]|uniref:metallophosphoesterase n=1 Tax=uncultured Acetobacteroides sp. TaxID=1760811 RepID=UPI0029F51519|nr:metallophosphoesterase [uncultured Acetobacteroides sp.]
MKTLTAKKAIINVAMSNDASRPVVINPTNSIVVDFSDLIGTSGDVIRGVKLDMVNADGTTIPVSIKLSSITGCHYARKITTSDGAKFDEGREYMVCVTIAVPDRGKSKIPYDYYGYFAVNYNLSLGSAGMSALNGRKLLVCISDIHLGAYERYTECRLNRDSLINFLQKVNDSPNVKELVIAGDLIDEWFLPANVDTLKGGSQQDFVNKIRDNNNTVFDGLNAICENPEIEVTYVPGNHDLLITDDEIRNVLPKMEQARERDAAGNVIIGLGTYEPKDFPEVAIEHGHRYNFFCAPDPISNNKNYPGKGPILPPGYFFTRIAVESVYNGLQQRQNSPYSISLTYGDESQFLCSLYGQLWQSVFKDFPVKQKYEEKFIVTNIDGLAGPYSEQDLTPQVGTDGRLYTILYPGIQDTWGERQRYNRVAVPIPTITAIEQSDSADGTDDMSNVQYFGNASSNKRVVIFGHSHVARILSYTTTDNKRAVYANSGTWIDSNKSNPTMTFVVLIPPKDQNSNLLFVNLYQYLPNGEVSLLDAQVITR